MRVGTSLAGADLLGPSCLNRQKDPCYNQAQRCGTMTHFRLITSAAVAVFCYRSFGALDAIIARACMVTSPYVPHDWSHKSVSWHPGDSEVYDDEGTRMLGYNAAAEQVIT